MYTIKKVWSSDITELIDKHANLHREEVGNSDNIVYKVSQGLIDNLVADPSNYNQLLSRWPSRRVMLIYFNDNFFKLYQVQSIRLVDLSDHKELINEIRNYDLEQLIHKKNSNCSIKAPHGGHFVTPSGKHAKIFIRVADAINSYNSMDRISFWLQELINDDLSGIIVDTPALLSVVVHAFNLRKKSVPFTCLNESAFENDLSSKADSILRKFSTRISSKGNILVLTSMSVSGSTEKSVVESLSLAGIKNEIDAWSIFSIKDAPVKSKCIISKNIEWYKSKIECGFCKSELEKKIYEIDGKTFFPKLAQQKIVRLLVKHARNLSGVNGLQSFYRKYACEPGAIRFHYSDDNDGYSSRHHAFYIDVLSLLAREDFVEEFENKLNDIFEQRGVADLVVYPPHPAAKKLIEIAKLKYDFEIIESSSLSSIAEEDVDKLASAEHILVLDDVLVTGGRQLGYLRNIREVFSGGNHSLNHLTFFSLVTRTEGPEVIDSLERAFKQHPWKNYSETLYKFLLPRWSEDQCPWCAEKKLLTDHVSDPMDDDSWYQDRLEKLSNIFNGGIIDNPLLCFEGMDRATMSAASPIVDAGYNESVVLFVIASALQALRCDKDNPLGNDLLFLNLFCTDTLDQYCDPLVQACLLRATKADEWSGRFYENLFESGIGQVFKTDGNAHLPEILIRSFEAGGNKIFKDKFFEPYNQYRFSLSVDQLVLKLEGQQLSKNFVN